ncbi:GNAT family N-acetyltransferase [Paenactinomyces guangxiensis]|uniref:GNAT family N-acetyltransferase n=2 Tax=Paenactinomyces guangxiensis TaxID=1490290 RepID=A0A7W2A7D2_9BACL|nr:GNAT family N-acetyltransferase [Paenactinomyces guangxiensis]MBH8590129.1 GNAT family N-acetyltransferase [Paenactinomyces guangxiensis]
MVRDQSVYTGFGIMTSSFFDQPFISLLMLQADYRRLGVGRALMTAMENQVQGPKLFTSTNESNIPIQKLCESLG